MKPEYQEIYDGLLKSYPAKSLRIIKTYYLGLADYDSNLALEHSYIQIFFLSTLLENQLDLDETLMNDFFTRENNRIEKKYGVFEIEQIQTIGGPR